jgi:hypothetical protein
LLLIRGILAALRQTFHLSSCLNSADHLSADWAGFATATVECHGIVLGHRAVLLLAQNFAQIDTGMAHYRHAPVKLVEPGAWPPLASVVRGLSHWFLPIRRAGHGTNKLILIKTEPQSA